LSVLYFETGYKTLQYYAFHTGFLFNDVLKIEAKLSKYKKLRPPQ
jgi:hypothetical protein